MMNNENALENQNMEQSEVVFELCDDAVFDMTLATIQYSIAPSHH